MMVFIWWTTCSQYELYGWRKKVYPWSYLWERRCLVTMNEWIWLWNICRQPVTFRTLLLTRRDTGILWILPLNCGLLVSYVILPYELRMSCFCYSIRIENRMLENLDAVTCMMCLCWRFRHGSSISAGRWLHGWHCHRHHVSHPRCRIQWIRYFRYVAFFLLPVCLSSFLHIISVARYRESHAIFVLVICDVSDSWTASYVSPLYSETKFAFASHVGSYCISDCTNCVSLSTHSVNKRWKNEYDSRISARTDRGRNKK